MGFFMIVNRRDRYFLLDEVSSSSSDSSDSSDSSSDSSSNSSSSQSVSDISSSSSSSSGDFIVEYEVIWDDSTPADYSTCRLKVTKSFSLFDGVWYDDFMDFYECASEAYGIQYSPPRWDYSYADGMGMASFITYGPACTGEGECYEKTYSEAWITANVPTTCPLPTAAPIETPTWTEMDITDWIGTETWHETLPHMVFSTSGNNLVCTSTQAQWVQFNVVIPQVAGASRAMKLVCTLSADYPGTNMFSNMSYGYSNSVGLVGWMGSQSVNDGTVASKTWQEVGVRGDTTISVQYHSNSTDEITWTIQLLQAPIWTT